MAQQAYKQNIVYLPETPSSMLSEHLGDQWQELHANIQARFMHDPAENELIHYKGHMDTRCSRTGWLFAVLTKIIGNPLTPFEGDAIPMDVKLFRCIKRKGVCWQRTYHLPNKKPYTVTSVKSSDSKSKHLLECVGGGFGMVLRVYAENQQLHFKGVHYFFQVGKFRLKLPHFITPGQTHVIHEDKGSGQFRFTIRMTHKQLGETFFQTGLFKRKVN